MWWTTSASLVATGLAVPDQQLDPAEGDQFGDAPVRAADHEDPAAFGVHAAGGRWTKLHEALKAHGHLPAQVQD